MKGLIMVAVILLGFSGLACVTTQPGKLVSSGICDIQFRGQLVEATTVAPAVPIEGQILSGRTSKGVLITGKVFDIDTLGPNAFIALVEGPGIRLFASIGVTVVPATP